MHARDQLFAHSCLPFPQTDQRAVCRRRVTRRIEGGWEARKKVTDILWRERKGKKLQEGEVGDATWSGDDGSDKETEENGGSEDKDVQARARKDKGGRNKEWRDTKESRN